MGHGLAMVCASRVLLNARLPIGCSSLGYESWGGSLFPNQIPPAVGIRRNRLVSGGGQGGKDPFKVLSTGRWRQSKGPNPPCLRLVSALETKICLKYHWLETEGLKTRGLTTGRELSLGFQARAEELHR